jgi:hypothetical protein
MSVITSANSGSWSSGSTWVGGAAPSSGDDAVIATGHTVTASGTQACASFTVQGTGKLVVAGTLTFTADSQIAANSTAGNRIEVQAGGVLECDPGASGTVTLWLGGTTEDVMTSVGYPTLRLDGAAGNRAILRRKAGAAGSFQARPAAHSIFSSNRGTAMLSADYGFVQNLSLLWLHHVGNAAAVRFVNSEFDGGVFRCRTTGNSDSAATSVLLEDSRFTSWEPTEYGFDLIGDGTRDRSVGEGGSTVRRCSIDARARIGTLQELGNGMGLLVEDCAIFKAGASLGFAFDLTLANKAIFRRMFFYGGDDSVGYNLVNARGEIADSYQFLRFITNTGGNPHYSASLGALVLRRATFDYYGPAGDDAGDPCSVQSGTDVGDAPGGEVIEAVSVKGTPLSGSAKVYPGTFWALSVNGTPEFPGGTLRVRNSTLYVPPNGSAASYTHAAYSGPGDRLTLDDCIVWSEAPTGGESGGAFIRNEQTELGQAMSVDVANGSRNHGYLLGTFNTNLVDGVTTSRYGLRAVKASSTEALPQITELDASPGFADPTRNFLAWAREQGHTGTDSELADAAIAAIFDDPTLANDLRTWVRAGYVPSNTDLLTANGGTEWAGAMQGDSGGGGSSGTGGARMRRLLLLLGAA